MNTLAAVVYDSRTWPSVSQIVQPSDFYSRPHHCLFKALSRLFEEHDGVIDTHNIVEYLDKIDELEDVGGRRYLEELAFYTGNIRCAARYAEIVREKSLQRQAISL